MLGKELKRVREAAGMSQERLAFEAGVHRTYISLLERNKKSPTLNVLLRLCKALNTSAAELIARVEQSREDHRDD
jgi:transcriptional regulator with XRE-family HTH domain